MSEADVRAAFASQARACAALGSPFTAWLCERLGRELTGETTVGARVLGWPGDPSTAADSVPLRLCGALHALALAGGDADLAALYERPRTDHAVWGTIARALGAHPEPLLAVLALPPQTNEVARSGALWPALGEVARRTNLPLLLLEVGASAGLNLLCDRFALDLGGKLRGDRTGEVRLAPEWRGAPYRGGEPVVAGRAGCDLRPYDLSDPAERRRLTAYTWPDQPDRLARQRAAIALAAPAPPAVEATDAVSWLRARLAEPAPEACRTLYTTIAWQYLSGPDRATGEALVAAAGARAEADGPIAFVRMENDGAEPGAALTLDLWAAGGHERHDLGRADFHGRWVDWAGI